MNRIGIHCFISLPTVVLSILLTSCNERPVAGTPSPQVQGYPIHQTLSTNTLLTPTASPFPPIESYPIASVYPMESFLLPTTMPFPTPPYPVETLLSQATEIPTQTPTFQSPIIYEGKLDCIPNVPYSHCSDEILGIEFEIPQDWGEVFTTMTTGDTGYAYGYTFEDLIARQIFEAATGGLSRDFSKGIEAGLTSFSGYGSTDSHRCLALQNIAPICEVIKPQVIFLMRFPESNSVCDPYADTIFSPVILVEINLPGNPKINGFVFVYPFLSQKARQGIFAILGYMDSSGATRCDPTSQEQFDIKIAELIAAIEAGTVDDETRQNINKLKHLAESIIFK